MSPSFAARKPGRSGVFTGWRTSSDCDGGACLEVGQGGPVIGVRDSEDPDGAVLTFGTRAWEAFTSGVKSMGGDD